MISPQIARHWNQIHTNAALFRRIDAVMRPAEHLGLDAEQKRVLERYHTSFRRAGAALDDAAKRRLAEIIERLAALGTAFSQNVLADEQAFTLRLEGEADLAGLPDFIREALRSEASERGIDGHAVTLVALQRRAVPAILRSPRSARKGLSRLRHARRQRRRDRQQSDHRRDGAAARRARAAPRLSRISRITGSTMPWRRRRRRCAICLTRSGRRRARSALADRDAMQALIQEDGGNFKLEPWDWRYYAEKLRQRVATSTKPPSSHISASSA